ncbi:primary-amine oxidase [Dictyobacter kobayashii]|uniref:Amine oxidase n=1 Tax=Dictyobacter kobayashii TaxID=2014872 RepID=A0A402AXX0_9CHLR|nr:primary-amine oxidase [Dictyobacter kobayashii]GCE23913.1 amine oxidase [Dictyobacter kobayashii]
MTDIHPETQIDTTALAILHPLEPLSAEEIQAAVRLLRTEHKLGEHVRFISVNLNEPPKEIVLNFQPGAAIEREAFIVLLDAEIGASYEAVVSITARRVVSWKQLEGVQPAMLPDELAATEKLLKGHPAFLEALRRHGITDMSLVMTDTWTVGYYESEELQQRRLARTIVYTRAQAEDNGYARPVDGLVVLTDLLTNEVLRIDDYGITPVPPESGNYTPEAIGTMRSDLKPIEITQPEGPSFTVNGHEVSWQKWRFRVGFNTREGLVLHTISYADQGRERPIIYRASLPEMVVPYGDPGVSHYRKNAFDVGEYGLGTLANALKLGCDCLGYIHYFDALMTDSHGEVLELPNAVCMHEEDYGILWKHYDWHTNRTEVRRSRRLVISFIATVDNYEYGFFWYLYQDGTIEFESKLTGIMSTGAIEAGKKPRYGQLVAPQLYAPVHQHIFNVRLDMMVDGLNNSVYEVHTEAEPLGPQNPHGNAFFAKSTLLATEQEAQQLIDPFSCRYWKIVNPSSLNALGEPVGYKIMPGENTLPFAHPESSVMKRAGFAQKHLWVTPYKQDERYPAGDYPNQHPGGNGLPRWTQANRSVENTDLVVWYTMNHNHIPRPEDWPVMPVAYIGFMLKPVGFFDRSPALDVPPSESHSDHCCEM